MNTNDQELEITIRDVKTGNVLHCAKVMGHYEVKPHQERAEPTGHHVAYRGESIRLTRGFEISVTGFTEEPPTATLGDGGQNTQAES